MSRPPLPEPFEKRLHAMPHAGLDECDAFFAGRGEVHRTLARFTARLDAVGVPYAVFGALALNAHGHHRVTTNIDVIVTSETWERIHDLLDEQEFVRPTSELRNLRDTLNGVRIDLVLAGDFPGDGQPQPVAFPDPSLEPLFVKNGIRFVTAEKLVELKLASGISHQLRYRDLGDVVSLIDSARLPREFGERLNPYVQPKWFEIWDAWSVDPMRDRY